MKLTPLHGRHDPNQNMDQIGFKGPDTYGIASIKLTYMETIRLEFKSPEMASCAHKLTGWDYWNGEPDILSVPLCEGMIVADNCYYRDWVITEVTL